jgi:UDP-GlcNAc:undecaprenyl-phosphate/decaprenyl-phosphate GlcNAc-1-phosphate transferase
VPGFQSFAAITLGCFAISALCTWLVRSLARRRGWLALPRVDRWHRDPTALFGGVAIYFTFVAGVLATIPLSRPLVGLLFLTTTMFAVGLVDDARHLGPHTKLVVQLTCGLLLYSSGYHFNDGFPWWLDLSIVVFWVVAITNAVNLLDNMNGLAAGIALIAGAFRLLWYRETGSIDGATTSAVFIGSVAGFLVFNYPRASIFMGDAGSFTVGFVLAALNLSNGRVYSKSLFSVLLFPVLVLAIPILDTSFVSIVRYFSGRAISQGGRDHVSHRLVAVGLSDAVAVLLLWGVSTAAGFVAFAMYKVGFSYAWFGTALLALGLLLFSVVLGRVRVYDEETLPASVGERRPGFRLPAEFRYKRQVLWVFVDASTIVLAIYGSYLLLFGESAEWASELARFARVAPVSVATVLTGLLLQGVYRTDWQHFSRHVAWSIVVGVTLGIAVPFGLFVFGPLGSGDQVATFVAAWGTIVGSVIGTRVFVKSLNAALRSGREAAPDPRLTKDVTP